MENLHVLEILCENFKEKVTYENTPIFGICLGMQLFSNHSEEGNCTGLGFIDFEL